MIFRRIRTNRQRRRPDQSRRAVAQRHDRDLAALAEPALLERDSLPVPPGYKDRAAFHRALALARVDHAGPLGAGPY